MYTFESETIYFVAYACRNTIYFASTAWSVYCLNWNESWYCNL